MGKQVDDVRAIDQVAAELADDIVVDYPLLIPIMAYDEKVSRVTLRRPEGADLLAIGNPVIFYPTTDSDLPKIEHDLPKVIKMVARLSRPAIPSSSLSKLDPQDIIGLAWAISPFFIPAR